MIPIVRRRLTITTQGVVDIPYTCTACGLTTLSHVRAQGVGHSTTAYVSPNEEGARRSAQENLEKNARAVVDACLCPRCGAPAQALRDKIAEWDRKTQGGTSTRKLAVLGIGMGITLSIALLCVGSMLAMPTQGSTWRDMIGAAACMAMGITLLGGLVSVIAYFFSGPGARPVVPTTNPTNLWFDRPPGT